MNVYDSDRMAGLLSHHGYQRSASPEDADLVLLNTCHIREKAADKVYSELGRLREMRDERRARGEDCLLAVAGCVAQAEGELMAKRAPFIDIVVGPQAYHRLPELLERRSRASGTVVETEFTLESKFDELPAAKHGGAASAFLTIQEGCDKFCTFCVVPYTRGAEESRPVQSLVDEARRMVAEGAREITLLGQNVNAYHGLGSDGVEWGLGRLIRVLAEIDGLERLRYTTSHPRDVDEELILAHRDIDKLMPFLHLPVQSGSDKVLKAMNRGYTALEFERVVDRLRIARPDLALSSDFIVGFPGEADEDFEATLALVERVGFVQSYSFKYSRRAGTPGAVMPGQVKPAVADERLQRLQSLLNDQEAAFNATSIGRVMPVMFERPGRHPGQWVGKSPYMQSVHVEADSNVLSQLKLVAIEHCNPHSLSGSIVTAAA